MKKLEKIDQELYSRVGEILRIRRKEKHLSLENVAECIGKSKGSIARYEAASSRFDTETFEAICAVLGLDPRRVLLEAKNEQIETSHRQTFEIDALIEGYSIADQKVKGTVFTMLDMGSIIDRMVKEERSREIAEGDQS